MADETARVLVLIAAIDAALGAEPAGTGTYIELQDGDWELIAAGLKSLSASPPLIEALKQCALALHHALRTDQVGWLQESAHKSARAALDNWESMHG